MKKKFFIWLFIAIAILISGCEQSPNIDNSIGKVSQNISTTNVVTIREFEFQPIILTISSGQTVTFINEGILDHSVQSTIGLFDSGPIKPGEKFNYEFDKKGTYEYACGIHSNMEHRLIVVK